MSLEKCLKKLRDAGQPISKEDRAAIQSYLDEGLSETEAVNKMLGIVKEDISEIARLAGESGAKVAKKKGRSQLLQDAVAAVTSLQLKQLEAIRAEHAVLTARLDAIVDESYDFDVIKGVLTQTGIMDLSDDAVVEKRFSEILFSGRLSHYGKLIKGRAIHGLVPSTPKNMLAQFRKMEAEQALRDAEQAKIEAGLKRLEERTDFAWGSVSLYQGSAVMNYVTDTISEALDGKPRTVESNGPEKSDETTTPPEPGVFFQAQNLPAWKEKTSAWMEENGYTEDEIARHMAAIEGQMKIFSALGPIELEFLPRGKGLNPAPKKGPRVGQGGPIRSNSDPMYRISFDASAMCVKRLEAGATAAMVQKKIGRALTASERMALVALFKSANKSAPCIYCYVEAPRNKSSSFVASAVKVAFSGKPMAKSWSKSVKAKGKAAQAEVAALGMQAIDVDVNALLDPEYGETQEAKDNLAKAPALYGFLKTMMLAAKANLPKVYEEYMGQILELDQGLLDELNNYAGLRFFSSSDFQAEHVADLMQAFFDMELRKVKAHAYTKVEDFVEIFGATGMKIQTSVFAKKDANGKIVMDDWQGMDWKAAKKYRKKYPNVGTVLVAADDDIVAWALQQDWIDYILPFHYSGLESRFYNQMEWQDFTSTQSEKLLNPAKGKKAKKIRMHEVTGGKGITNEAATRKYLTLARQRGLVPVFPAFMFKDFVPAERTGNELADKKARNEANKVAVRRWEIMVNRGRIEWSEINMDYFKLRKDYARSDTQFDPVTSNINVKRADKVLQSFLSGNEPGAIPDEKIGKILVDIIDQAEAAGEDVGVSALGAVKAGRNLVANYLNGIPITTETTKVLNQAPGPESLDENGNYHTRQPGVRDDGAKKKKVAKKKTSKKKVSKKKATKKKVNAAQARLEALVNYKIMVRHETVSELSVGTDVANTANEVAHIVAPMRRRQQEEFLAVVTDENGKVLNIISHTKGGQDSASVFLGVLAGAIYATRGARKVWFAHNHPSGNMAPSFADQRIQGKIFNLMDAWPGGPVSVEGHVVVGYHSDQFVHLGPTGHGGGDVKTILPLPRKKKVAVTVREMRGAIDKSSALTGPGDAQAFFRGANIPDGVLMLNNMNVPMGYITMPDGFMSKMKDMDSDGDTGVSRLLRAMSDVGANGFIVYTEEGSTDARNNMAAFAAHSQMNFLDHIVGKGLKSYAHDIVNIDPYGALPEFYQSEIPGSDAASNPNAKLGLYSGVLSAALGLKMNKGAGQQMLSMILKTPGVKKEEVETLGLPEYLSLKKSYTRNEVVEFVKLNGVQIKELTLREAGDIPESMPELDQNSPEFADMSQMWVEQQIDASEITSPDYGATWVIETAWDGDTIEDNGTADHDTGGRTMNPIESQEEAMDLLNDAAWEAVFEYDPIEIRNALGDSWTNRQGVDQIPIEIQNARDAALPEWEGKLLKVMLELTKFTLSEDGAPTWSVELGNGEILRDNNGDMFLSEEDAREAAIEYYRVLMESMTLEDIADAVEERLPANLRIPVNPADHHALARQSLIDDWVSYTKDFSDVTQRPDGTFQIEAWHLAEDPIAISPITGGPIQTREEADAAMEQAARDHVENYSNEYIADLLEVELESYYPPPDGTVADGIAKHRTWSVKGGSNYREILLTLPSDFLSREVIMPRELSAKEVEQGALDRDNAWEKIASLDNYPSSFPKEYTYQAGLWAKDKAPDGLYKAWVDGVTRAMGYAPTRAVSIETKITVDPDWRRKMDYSEPHYGEIADNVFAHYRVDDRIGPEGEKILFLQEGQSELHAKGGRPEVGYMSTKSTDDQLRDIQKRTEETWKKYNLSDDLGDLEETLLLEKWVEMDRDNSGKWYAVDKHGNHSEKRFNEIEDLEEWMLEENGGVPFEAWAELRNLQREWMDAESGNNHGMPDLPFKGNAWKELIFKRLMRMAAEGGYDMVAWATGDQNKNHYNLGRVVESISVSPTSTAGTRSVQLFLQNGQERNMRVNDKGIVVSVTGQGMEEMRGKPLEEGVGREVADKIMSPMEFKPLGGWNIVPARGKVKWDMEGVVWHRDVRNIAGYVEMTSQSFGPQSRGVGIKDWFVAVNDEGELLKDFSGHIVAVNNQDVFKELLFDRIALSGEGSFRISTDQLSVGGRWMNKLYDTVYVNVANKVARKLDKSAPRAGMITIDTQPGYAEAVHAISVTEEMRESAMKGQPLFQKERAKISFDQNNKATITLLKAHDWSSFLHESGHLYLEMLGDLAEMPGAPERIVNDYAKILKWLGVESRAGIQREHHEKWARGFEAYLREGKAPSLELQSSFAAFKGWLRQIYKYLSQLDVELNDEIRGVMDRLMASDDAIEQAKKAQNYTALFLTAEAMGMSEEMFSAYKKSLIEARQEGDAELTQRLLAIQVRQAKEWWKKERSKMRDVVADEVYKARVYRALAHLQKGKNPDGSELNTPPVKLDRDQLIARYGKEYLKRLPRPYVYAVTGGVDMDVVAAMFDYASGDEMIQELVRSIPMNKMIEDETDARMKESFPDPLTDGSLLDEAIHSMHSEHQAKVMEMELKALRRKQREVKPFVSAAVKTMQREDRQSREANLGQLPNADDRAIIKAAAIQIIATRQIRNLNPNEFRVAESKASNRAFNEAAKGNYEKAAEAKRQQILNFELFRAATAAKKESEKTQAYLKRFTTKKVRARLGRSGLIEKIDLLLNNIDFRKISMAQADRNTAQKEMLDAIEAGELIAPASVVATLEDRGKNWKNMTVEEFRALRDTVKQIAHIAKKEVEAIVNEEKRIIQEAADEIAESLTTSNKVVPAGIEEETKGEKISRGGKQLLNNWLRPSSIARILDNAGFGALTRHIIVPMRRAYAERLEPMFIKAADDVSEIYRKHYTLSELSGLNKREFIPELNATLSKAAIISIALNYGSESNRMALLGGIKRNGEAAFPQAGVAAALAKMTKRDWLFVQDIWDYLDTYWPMLAKAERQRRGVAPEKVKAMVFTITTADGETMTLKGGYYPLKFDRRHSDMAKGEEIDDAYAKLTSNVFIGANTRAGATHERVRNHKKVVKLGLKTIDLHLREIIRDIAIGDEVNFIKRLLAHADVKRAFIDTGNETALDELNRWLVDAAVGELPAESYLEKSAAWISSGFTKSKLAWNVMTTVLQVTGLPQTIAFVGLESFRHGIARFARNPVAGHKLIMEKSAFMRTRYQTNSWNKDVADTEAHLNSLFGGEPSRAKIALNALSATFFYPIARMQMPVDEVTWMAGFWKAQNKEGLTGKAAIAYADAQVEGAQTSGFFSDRSGIERGTTGNRNKQQRFIKLWTTLVSYMLAKGNIAYEKGRRFSKAPSVSGAVFLATDLLLLYTVEAMIAAALYGQWPDDDDDENFAVWVAKETAASAVSGIPFVREIPSAKFGGGNTPLGAATKGLFDLGTQIEQGDVDKALIRQLNSVGGTFFHYPSSQTNRAIDAYWRDSEGEDVPFYEYFTGPRRKRD